MLPSVLGSWYSSSVPLLTGLVPVCFLAVLVRHSHAPLRAGAMVFILLGTARGGNLYHKKGALVFCTAMVIVLCFVGGVRGRFAVLEVSMAGSLYLAYLTRSQSRTVKHARYGFNNHVFARAYTLPFEVS